jgi:hypothetical protein
LVKEGGGNCEGREVFSRERKEGMEDLLREKFFVTGTHENESS